MGNKIGPKEAQIRALREAKAGLAAREAARRERRIETENREAEAEESAAPNTIVKDLQAQADAVPVKKRGRPKKGSGYDHAEYMRKRRAKS